jgi:F-type H+-transporting ATPase subunit epsilon
VPGRLTFVHVQYEELAIVAGGMLEVQPNLVTVLADTAVRGKD